MAVAEYRVCRKRSRIAVAWKPGVLAWQDIEKTVAECVASRNIKAAEKHFGIEVSNIAHSM